MSKSPPTLSAAYCRARSYVGEKWAASRAAVVGAALVLALVMITIAAPLLVPAGPTTMDYDIPFNAPSLGHPFGTDHFGRDVLGRVLYGYRISLTVAFGSVAVAVLVGIPLGLLAGFAGGWVENVIMRPMDVLISFPAMILAVALAGFLGRSTAVTTLAVAIVYVPVVVRVMRGSAMEVSRELFVEGARARGASHVRLMLRHVLPNAWGPVLVQASVLMGFAILLEAALSFIGLGSQPPQPSLGLMLSENRQYMREAPWVVVFPGFAIGLAVLGFNMLGDGLRTLLSPSGRRS